MSYCNEFYIPPSITPLIGINTIISVGGSAVPVIPAGAYGGYIWNPLTDSDQGVTAEPLYVDQLEQPGLSAFGSTIALAPGEMFNITVVKSTLIVSANAATSGHRFTAVYWMGP